VKGGPRVTPPARPSARPHGRRQFDPLAELVERVGVDAGIWREVSREDAALDDPLPATRLARRLQADGIE